MLFNYLLKYFFLINKSAEKALVDKTRINENPSIFFSANAFPMRILKAINSSLDVYELLVAGCTDEELGQVVPRLLNIATKETKLEIISVSTKPRYSCFKPHQ